MTTTVLHNCVDDWLNAYQEFFKVLDAVPYQLREQPGACGIWSVRQVVAHLSGWHEIALAQFEGFERNHTPDAIFDEDAVNEENVAMRMHLSWSQTMAELRVRLATLYDYLSGLMKRGVPDDPRFELWLTALAQDARDHMDQIAIWVAEIS